MENETYYFNVTVDYDKNEIEKLMDRVEEFNNMDGRLAYDGVSTDGELQFIYQIEDCEDEVSALEGVEKLTELFQTEITWKHIPPSAVSQLAKKKLSHAAGGCRAHTTYDGRQRWSIRNWQDIIDSMEGTTGYDILRDFLYKLHNYIINNQKIECKGNYNLAIITDSKDYDKKRIVNTVYDLLCSSNLITDYQIVERGFEPFVDGDGSEEQFYFINEEWDLLERISPFQRGLEKEALAKMRVPKGKFITFLSSEQYNEVKNLASFNLIFPHQVMMPNLTSQDKFSLLQNQAREFGITLDDSFQEHGLLQYDMDVLMQCLVRAVTNKLYEQDYQEEVLMPEDFELNTEQQNNRVKVDAWAELETLIGLENVKQLIKKICTFLRKRGREAVPSLHMVFRGNPGTGKTTVARIIGKLFAEIGLLSPDGIFIEADRRALVGKYVGHSAPRTAKLVKKSLGGILFIDEAYSLNQKDGFSHETVSTLVKLMEDYRDEFVCIMAGYTDEMNDFLDMNPGMRERIQFYIDFPDYTATELRDIFLRYCNQEHYKVDASAMQLLDEHFSFMVTYKDRNFANARLVRKVFERIRLNQAMRSDEDDITKEDVITTFAEPDIAKYIRITSSKVKNIGFVA